MVSGLILQGEREIEGAVQVVSGNGNLPLKVGSTHTNS